MNLRKTINLTFVAAIWSLAAVEWLHADTLTIVIPNVEKPDGMLMVQILSSESEFNSEAPAVASIMQRAQTGEMTFATDLPSGEYAIQIMHDENGNGELDANFVGMPTEPWAFSNNAVGNFGPAKWQDAKFQLDGEVTQTINLN